MVGIGIIGRSVTFSIGGAAVVGVISKSLTFNNESLDSTDDDSSGWQEFLAEPGLKSVEFSVTAKAKNLEMVNAYFNSSQIFAVVVDYPEGSQLTFNAFLNSVSDSYNSNELGEIEFPFASSGPVTFTPGT